MGSSEVAHGGKRAGRKLRAYQVRSPKWALPGPPPPGYEHRRLWRSIEGTGEGEWEHVEELPRAWDASQVAVAYRAAFRVLRAIGLPLFAYETWCWQAAGTWWALPDASGGELLAVEPKGAWRLPRRGRTAASGAYPPEFAEAFGRASGPLEWAFWVLDTVADLRSLNHSRQGAVRALEPLTSRPEWLALQAAVDASHDPFLESAVWQVRQVLETAALNVASPAFIQGFELGQGLGAFAAIDAVRAGEAERLARTGKIEMRALLREIVQDAAAKGPLRLHVLAQTLLEERNATERGRQLARLGLPEGANRVAALLREEAKALGQPTQGVGRRRGPT